MRSFCALACEKAEMRTDFAPFFNQDYTNLLSSFFGQLLQLDGG
jgi:hypothetical protein